MKTPAIHDCVVLVRRTPMLDRSPARVAAMQHLIDDGVVWMLQPYIGAVAEWMIDEGLCSPGPWGRISRCGRRRKVTP